MLLADANSCGAIFICTVLAGSIVYDLWTLFTCLLWQHR